MCLLFAVLLPRVCVCELTQPVESMDRNVFLMRGEGGEPYYLTTFLHGDEEAQEEVHSFSEVAGFLIGVPFPCVWFFQFPFLRSSSLSAFFFLGG